MIKHKPNKICPHCKSELDYINYKSPEITYGTVGPEWHWESDNSDTNDSAIFSCPNCEEILSERLSKELMA